VRWAWGPCIADGPRSTAPGGPARPPRASCCSSTAGRDAMIYILLWLLGAPLTLILILFLLGVGR
jgi:hypothetical protein